MSIGSIRIGFIQDEALHIQASGNVALSNFKAENPCGNIWTNVGLSWTNVDLLKISGVYAFSFKKTWRALSSASKQQSLYTNLGEYEFAYND